MGPKCADSCHAGRPQAAILWFHRAMSPPPEIDDFAPLEANCSISEQQPRPTREKAHSQSRLGWTGGQQCICSCIRRGTEGGVLAHAHNAFEAELSANASVASA